MNAPPLIEQLRRYAALAYRETGVEPERRALVELGVRLSDGWMDHGEVAALLLINNLGR